MEIVVRKGHAELVSASAAAKDERLQTTMADADIHQHDAHSFIEEICEFTLMLNSFQHSRNVRRMIQ